MIRKITAVALCVLLVANLILYALSKISGIIFWGVLALIALFAYLVLPRIKPNK